MKNCARLAHDNFPRLSSQAQSHIGLKNDARISLYSLPRPELHAKFHSFGEGECQISKDMKIIQACIQLLYLYNICQGHSLNSVKRKRREMREEKEQEAKDQMVKDRIGGDGVGSKQILRKAKRRSATSALIWWMAQLSNIDLHRQKQTRDLFHLMLIVLCVRFFYEPWSSQDSIIGSRVASAVALAYIASVAKPQQ